MNSCETIIKPRYAETDQMGVIYHGSYFPWFEAGRDDFFRRMGFSYSSLEKCGYMMPVLNISCKYLRPSKYDESIIVKTFLQEFKGIRVKFKYEIYREYDRVLLAEAHIDYTFLNNLFQPVNMKKIKKEFWELLINQLND